jgi:CRP-like cAMP-binding protein
MYARQDETVMDTLPREKQLRIVDILGAHALFKGCDPDFVIRIAEQSHIIKAEKNQVLFVHGEPASRFFLVLGGWVKLFRETLDGAQAVVDILPEGKFLGKTAIFYDNQYPYSAEAVEPSVLISLPTALLKKGVEEIPALTFAMLALTAAKDHEKERELEHRTLQNAPQRIACFLLRLAENTQSGPVTLHLPYDKTLIAARLGMQPETFSRALGKLRDATGLEIQGGTVHISALDRLIAFSCSACSFQFPCRDLCEQTAQGR